MLKRKLYGLAIGIVAITPISIAQFHNPNGIAKSFGRDGDCVDCRLSREIPGNFSPKGGELDIAAINRNLNNGISGMIHGSSFTVGANPVLRAVTGIQIEQKTYAQQQQEQFKKQLEESAKNGPILPPDFMGIPFLKAMEGKTNAPWVDYTAALNQGLGGGSLLAYVCDPFRVGISPSLIPPVQSLPAVQAMYGFSPQF